MHEDQARTIVSSAIVNALSGVDHSLSSTAIDDLAAELLPFWAQPQQAAPVPGKLGALLPLGYVIPDQDLKVVETCFSVLTAAAGAGFLLPQFGADPTKGLTVPITGIIVAVLKLVQNLRLAVRLAPLEYALIALLSKASPDGTTVSTLVGALRSSWPDESAESIEARLIAMTTCATISGTRTALVWTDGSGIWRANGI